MKHYDDLLIELKKVKERGFITSHRSGDTGIGKTLEDLLGIEENNIPGPDGHQTELKSARKDSPSMMTLFTKAPMPKNINSKLLERFGLESDNGKKKLHTTIDAVSRNTLYGNDGFIISVCDSRVNIDHCDYRDMDTPYWEKQDLERAFYRKYPQNLLYIKADSRSNGKNEEFHFNEAWLMNGFDFDNFIKLLKEGKIRVDIRIGQYPDGSSHDHGTGFRIFPNALNQCFSYSKKVMG